MLRLYTGDDNGLLKQIDIPHANRVIAEASTSKCQITAFGNQQQGNEIAFIARSQRSPLMCGLKSGAIKYLKHQDPSFPSSGALEPLLSASSDPIINQNKKRVQSSTPQLISFQNVPNSNDSDLFMRAFSDGRVESFSIGLEEKSVTVENQTSVDLKLDGTQSLCSVEAFADSCFAYGGKNLNLALWDLQTNKSKFKFKNVSHDKLDMEVPIWISDIEHLADGQKFATGTAHHQVRLYDAKAQKRPTLSVVIGEHKINQVRVSPCGNYLVVANGLGLVYKLDLRSSLRCAGAYPGNKGSVRDIQFSEDGVYMSTVGLDRYLRVYNFETRKKVADVYLKQKLNCSIVDGWVEAKVESKAAPNKTSSAVSSQSPVSDEDEEEQDAIWDLLDEVEATKPKRLKSRPAVRSK
jgi:WD40 repeat protein